MENENNAVELNLTESVQDDAALAQGESLSEILEQNIDDGNQQTVQDTVPEKEPGWIKGRINKAVEKAVAETEARLTKHYEEMLAPIRESVFERQAQELVDSGEFKSLEIAKEYLSLKGGMPLPKQQEQQNTKPERDANGRFTSSNAPDPAVNVRADMLAKQAQKIKANYGVDVMAAFKDDPDVKQKIISGEWDFYDVAESLSESRSNRPTAPVRSANGSGVSSSSIADMTDAQFRKLQENLSMGRRYDMRK